MLRLLRWLLAVCVFCSVHTQLAAVDPWWDPRVWPETFVDDEKPFVEFTCGAYLKSQDTLSWLKKGRQIFSTITQPDDGYRTLKLLWPLASLNNVKVYCLKQNKTETLSKSIPIAFKKNKYPEITAYEWGPWLMPAAYLDDGKRVELTCYAYLNKLTTLSLYQIKDKTESLGMIRQENEYSYVKITLQKTLEQSDNGSKIYCTRQKSRNKYDHSKEILITFNKQIEALGPVILEPSTDVVFFDEGDALEFVCSGSESDDGRNPTWYLETPGLYQVEPPYQYFYKYTNQNRLTLRMDVFDHGKLLYCAQKLPNGTVSTNGQLYSRTITLLHRAQCHTRDQPLVIPATFVDEHKPCIQFTCYAFLKPGQLLSWHQSTELNKSAGSLLRMIQLQNNGTKEGEWTVLTLNKTLEPSDSGSEIYCAQQSVRPDGSFSDVKQTERIPLTIRRDIPSLERPFIRVEPNNAKVYFDVNTTLRLTCGGSKPVDGRTYTWFSKESESSLTVPNDQKYDASTNVNVLHLSVNESHHLNKLFCAQGFLSYIRDTNGSLHVKSYGELVVSIRTTLIQQEKDEEKQVFALRSSPGKSASWWVLGAVVGVASLWIILLIVAALRLRRKVHELESKIQAEEAIRARAPCPLPENPTYEQVYAHGAGLMRPRCK